MASVYLLGTSSPYCSQSPDYRNHVKQYEGMLEKGYNRGPFIDSANKKYAYLGAPYCASSVSMILDRSDAGQPKYRGAWAKAFADGTSVNSRRVWEGKDTIPRHSVIVFTRKGGGHVELHISNASGIMRCFGFNTSPDGKAGSQWNGTWSGYKNRNMKKTLSPYNVFRVTHFTPVTYATHNTRRHHCAGSCSISDTPAEHVRSLHQKPYNRFRHDGDRAQSHSPARYSIRR